MNGRACTSRRAFTLLELIVVITIIAILISLLLAAGGAITRNAKMNQTKGVLAALDRALEEYMMANNGNIPPFNAADYAAVPGRDGPNPPLGTNSPDPLGYINNGYMPQRPDASVFIRQARGIGDVNAIIGGVPERFLIVTAIPQSIASDPLLEINDHDTSPSFVDAWANNDWPGLAEVGTSSVDKAWPIREQSLIYYVHPGNRRNRNDNALNVHPDAQELYGETLNGRPYFMSAGPDGFYGHPENLDEIAAFYSMRATNDQERALVLKQARKDNVYSIPVDINFTVNPGVINAFPQLN